jgi:HSP20 family protein
MNWPTLSPFGRKSDLTVGGEADPFTSFRREMDRLFESFGRQMAWPRELGGVTMAPSVDVSETDKEVRIDVELPGVDQKDVELVVSDNILTIKGEKKAEKEEKNKDFQLVERSYGSFSRSLNLPFSPDPSKAKAEFKKGVLTVTLPKPPEAETKAKKIAIAKG